MGLSCYSKNSFFSVALVCAFIPSAAFAAESNARLTSAKEEFREIVKSRPQANVRAVAFLVNHMSLEDLRVRISHWKVKVRGFRHATPSRSGGYTLAPEETVDQAIANYRRDHVKFSRERVEAERRFMAGAADEQLREAFRTSIRQGQAQIEEAELSGPRIVGIQLEGTAEELFAIEQASNFVRVMELSQPGRPQPALAPEHPVVPSRR